jgi:hypothetical protein
MNGRAIRCYRNRKRQPGRLWVSRCDSGVVVNVTGRWGRLHNSSLCAVARYTNPAPTARKARTIPELSVSHVTQAAGCPEQFDIAFLDWLNLSRKPGSGAASLFNHTRLGRACWFRWILTHWLSLQVDGLDVGPDLADYTSLLPHQTGAGRRIQCLMRSSRWYLNATH